MTDNEIIKALETIDDVGDCSRDCIFYEGKVHSCGGTIARHALTVINRQKAEIERLTAMVEAAEDYLNPLPFKNAYDDAIEKAKSEAIKEFAERLKVEMADKKYKYVTETNYSKTVNAVIDACIGATDNLVKETIEEGAEMTDEQYERARKIRIEIENLEWIKKEIKKEVIIQFNISAVKGLRETLIKAVEQEIDKRKDEYKRL